MRVLIAIAEPELGGQLQAALAHAGLAIQHGPALADGPRDPPDFDVVIVDADHAGDRLAAIVDEWRGRLPTPGVIALGSSAHARAHAIDARVTLVEPSASLSTLVATLRNADALRDDPICWANLRAALSLPPARNESASWPATLLHARSGPVGAARAALRPRAQHYATTTELFDHMRDERMLSVPELGACALADGTRTLHGVVQASEMDRPALALLVWTLASIGALELTPEVRDVATPARRALHEIRDHVRARRERLAHATLYDVLEVTPQAEWEAIDAAYQLLASRYAPAALAAYDLGELAELVVPLWEIAEQAHRTLVDEPARDRYNASMHGRWDEMHSTWALDELKLRDAAEAFGRGQRALAAGDAHRAMSELASACRHQPRHPDYEANLAWARYRVQVAAGKDAVATARVERDHVERWLAGCRPWPRALVALAMLCVAAGDIEAARWHLHVSLSIDPNAPAAVQLAQRLGPRR